MRGKAVFTIVAVAVAMVVGACTSEGTSEGGTGDKAGGAGEPVVLKMATVNGDLDFTPQIQYLVERVAQLSDGNIQIEVVYEVGDFAPDADQKVVRGVASSEFDLGFTSTVGYEALGAENFIALSAPMLIDSYALEDAVIESGLTYQMLPGLEDIGVTGLGVLGAPCASRSPWMVLSSAPLIGAGSRSGPLTRTARRRRSERSPPHPWRSSGIPATGRSRRVPSMGSNPASTHTGSTVRRRQRPTWPRT